MRKHKSNILPALKFGGGRTGFVQVSVGKRGRVVVKGDASFSLPELQALLSQLHWFAAQVAEQAGAAAPPASGTSTTRETPARSSIEQLSLPLTDDVRSVAGFAHATTPTAITR